MGWELLIAVALMIISAAMTASAMPDPVVPEAGKLDTPSADEGGDIPVVFGTEMIKSSNVVWYGDSRTEAIKSGGGGKK